MDKSAFTSIFGECAPIVAGAAEVLKRREDYDEWPELMKARLWTCGPRTGESAPHDHDWMALAEDLQLARELTMQMAGVKLASDTDCPFSPFVYHQAPPGELADVLFDALQPRDDAELGVDPVLEGEVVFWDEEVNEEPEEFLDDEEIARYRATSDRMKAELTDLTRLGFTEADTIYPLFYVGRARSGSIVGLWTARVDT